MKIDLTEKISTHFERLEALADEASQPDQDESYSSRASAMTALTGVIRELIKEQEKLNNMATLQELQSAIVEALEDKDQKFKDDVLEILERRLEQLN